VSVAVIIAARAFTDGRGEVMGMKTGASEAEPIWTGCLGKLTKRSFADGEPHLDVRHCRSEETARLHVQG
jgi:transposase-like protein